MSRDEMLEEIRDAAVRYDLLRVSDLPALAPDESRLLPHPRPAWSQQ